VDDVVAHLLPGEIQHHLVAAQLPGAPGHVKAPVRVRGVQFLKSIEQKSRNG
jgi:hypothetical protein